MALTRWRIRDQVGACWVDSEEEIRVGVEGLKSCGMSCELHMNIFVRSIRYNRRIQSSLNFQSCPWLVSKIVDN